MAQVKYQLEISDFLHKGKPKKFDISGFQFKGAQTNSLLLTMSGSSSPNGGVGLGSVKTVGGNSEITIFRTADELSNILHYKMINNNLISKVSLFLIQENSRQIVDLFEVLVLSVFQNNNEFNTEQVVLFYKKISKFSVKIQSVSVR